MHFDVISLFSDMFTSFTEQGVIGQAYQKKLWSLAVHSPRQFALNNYGAVDDKPYGGGAGMVMAYQPLAETLAHIAPTVDQPVVYLSASGTSFTHAMAQRLSKCNRLVLVCGRYEGVDQRFIDLHVDEEIAVGSFVMSGGELPALCVMDALLRLRSGVLGNEESLSEESFGNETAQLEYPHYTRPQTITAIDVAGRTHSQAKVDVPHVLLSGNHADIHAWRTEQRQLRTQQAHQTQEHSE